MRRILTLIFLCFSMSASAIMVHLYYGPDHYGRWIDIVFEGKNMFRWLGGGTNDFGLYVHHSPTDSITRCPDVVNEMIYGSWYFRADNKQVKVNDDGSFVYKTIFNQERYDTKTLTFAPDLSWVEIEFFHPWAWGNGINTERLPLVKFYVHLGSGDHTYVGLKTIKPGDIRTAAQAAGLAPVHNADGKVYVPEDPPEYHLGLVGTQPSDTLSAIDAVAMLHEATALNSGRIPQELIYLHTDNNAYYKGDRIHFACYVASAHGLKPTDLSQTVYVELLNPSGKVIDRCVLKAKDGRCHGSLEVNELPFYSGYYEIRAYTAYMLNFGEETVFSRTIPVYNEPQTDGHWAERDMLQYGTGKFVYERPQPASLDNVNLKFYPEGGHMVKGLPATVAFEITDRLRRPLKAEGKLVERGSGAEVTLFSSDAMGRGEFRFVPGDGKYRAEVTIDGQRYLCDLPNPMADGIALSVADSAEGDSVTVRVERTADFPVTTAGLSITCRGTLCSRAIFDLTSESAATISMARSQLPTGVLQATLFDASANRLADRLFFNHRAEDLVSMDCQFDKAEYAPHEAVEMTVTMSEAAPFSISVTDAANHTPYGSNILAHLLLSSEIKGYVHKPAWYFEDPADPERQKALDRLLMVQGWRRYSWEHLAALKPYPLKTFPEQGIDVHGMVLDRWSGKPKPDVDVMALLSLPESGMKVNDDFDNLDIFRTDSLGQFFFTTDLHDNHILTLGTSKKGRTARDHIVLNRYRKPKGRRYDPAEIPWGDDLIWDDDTISTTDDDPAYAGTVRLKEIEVNAKKHSRELEIGQIKQNSVSSYDVEDMSNTLRDQGVRVLRNVTDLLPLINSKFLFENMKLTYRGKRPLIVLDDGVEHNVRALESTNLDYINPIDLPLESIDKIYINEQPEVITSYALDYLEAYDFNARITATERFGCVVFLELNPKKITDVKLGMRRTPLEGYTSLVEFYSPDYEALPPTGEDYRRTLYWNPEVVPDENGVAKVKFFNNSTARTFKHSTATLTATGHLGGN